ncbi:hypothetical protein pdam_00022954 [Pocillopora damicornis]|uniref:GST C-terminal domain-containing protein n=1 Tax=Pocillopora damicornis TaxID=46731 RepID=A0A3M6UKI9_POCDA|nr:hypothetical protein pdam_00022954 [Pocillopora damicornis]
MDEHQIFDSTLLEPHKNLKIHLHKYSTTAHTISNDFLKRIEELPTIAAYLKSDRFKPRPINNKMAKFK